MQIGTSMKEVQEQMADSRFDPNGIPKPQQQNLCRLAHLNGCKKVCVLLFLLCSFCFIDQLQKPRLIVRQRKHNLHFCPKFMTRTMVSKRSRPSTIIQLPKLSPPSLNSLSSSHNMMNLNHSACLTAYFALLAQVKSMSRLSKKPYCNKPNW